MSKSKSFEFESMGLTNNDIFRMLRVHYDLASNPAEIEQIEDADTGETFTFLSLPAEDGIYILKRLEELNREWTPDPHVGSDEARENSLDRERLG